MSFDFESPPGILLLWMRASSAVWFSYACWTTLRKYPEKRRFYVAYYIIFAVWILSMPIMSGIVAPHISITYRKRVVFFVECCSLFAAHLFMGALWWPSNFVETFPFLPEVGAEKQPGRVGSQCGGEGNVISSASRARVALTGGSAHVQEIDPTRTAFEMVSQLRFQLMALQGFQSKGGRKTTTRTVHACNVVETTTTTTTMAGNGEIGGTTLQLTITGSGFLMHMVRIIAGTLLEVGCGMRTVQGATRALATLSRQDAGPTLPSARLCLDCVHYDQLEEEQPYL